MTIRDIRTVHSQFSSYSDEDDSNAVTQMPSNAFSVARAVNMSMNEPFCPIQLSLSCENLINVDIGSLSDPFVVVRQQIDSGPWHEVGRTEAKANNLNPKRTQKIEFKVYDVAGAFNSNDTRFLDLSCQVELGVASCLLASVVKGSNSKLQMKLRATEISSESVFDTDYGTILVQAEEVHANNIEITIQLAAYDLPKINNGALHRKTLPNPFLIISRQTKGDNFIRCFQTEVKYSEQNPMWEPFTETLTNLANGRKDTPIRLEVYSHSKTGNHKIICRATTNVAEMIDNAGMPVANLKNKEEKLPVLHVLTCSLEQKPTFFDFLQSGLELQFMCAIDYTISNGDRSSPDNLHYIEHDGFSSYSRAIHQIGSILEFYDSDKKFPLFGFGGKRYKGAPVSHCFAINDDEENPEVYGVDGIMTAYEKSLETAVFSGPTYFSHVIRKAAEEAAKLKKKGTKNLGYLILLILTDGIIDDMQKTKDEICKAAKLPMSIIIVGIGNANFNSMDELDGDHQRISNHQNEPAARDIVQFVPICRFENAHSSTLASEVLQEIPSAVVEYYQMMNIMPSNLSTDFRASSTKSGRMPYSTTCSDSSTSQITSRFF